MRFCRAGAGTSATDVANPRPDAPGQLLAGEVVAPARWRRTRMVHVPTEDKPGWASGSRAGPPVPRGGGGGAHLARR